MTHLVLLLDEKQIPIPEAAEWESSLVARPDDGFVGLGFVLRDEKGEPIGGAAMTADQALEQARYFIDVAGKLLLRTNPTKARAVAEDIISDGIGLVMKHAARR